MRHPQSIRSGDHQRLGSRLRPPRRGRRKRFSRSCGPARCSFRALPGRGPPRRGERVLRFGARRPRPRPRLRDGPHRPRRRGLLRAPRRDRPEDRAQLLKSVRLSQAAELVAVFNETPRPPSARARASSTSDAGPRTTALPSPWPVTTSLIADIPSKVASPPALCAPGASGRGDRGRQHQLEAASCRAARRDRLRRGARAPALSPLDGEVAARRPARRRALVGQRLCLPREAPGRKPSRRGLQGAAARQARAEEAMRADPPGGPAGLPSREAAAGTAPANAPSKEPKQ